MEYLTDQFQLFFCFCIGNTKNSYILFWHWQHNWHSYRQLATYALSCLCIPISSAVVEWVFSQITSVFWCGKVVILNVWQVTILCHFCLFFKLCSWCFQQPSGDSSTRVGLPIRLFWREILKFWLFLNTFVFSSFGKAWLWQNNVWVAFSLQISSDETQWLRRVHRILQIFYWCIKNDRCYFW